MLSLYEITLRSFVVGSTPPAEKQRFIRGQIIINAAAAAKARALAVPLGQMRHELQGGSVEPEQWAEYGNQVD